MSSKHYIDVQIVCVLMCIYSLETLKLPTRFSLFFVLDFTHLEIIFIEAVKRTFSICQTSSGIKLSVSMIYFLLAITLISLGLLRRNLSEYFRKVDNVKIVFFFFFRNLGVFFPLLFWTKLLKSRDCINENLSDKRMIEGMSGQSQELLKIVLMNLVCQNGYFTCPAAVTGLFCAPRLFLADVLLLYPWTINCLLNT